MKKNTENEEDKIDYDILTDLFDVNYDIDLSKKDMEYLSELSVEIRKYVMKFGTENEVQIEEIILDTLLKDKKTKIIEFLNISIDEDIDNTLKEKLADPNFIKIENKDDEKDILKDYVRDDMLNDVYMSWRGYIKRNSGSKEEFTKVSKAVLPLKKIDALYGLLQDNFNKINFFSQKDDEEQGDIIMITIKKGREVLMNTPYPICDTAKTTEILSVFAIKMTNLIGFSKDFRNDLFDTAIASYESKNVNNNTTKPIERD